MERCCLLRASRDGVLHGQHHGDRCVHGNPDIGIAAWLTEVLSPVFANVSATMFMVIMLVFCGILCSFCTGSIPLAITFAVAMPLCTTIYAGRLTPWSSVLWRLFLQIRHGRLRRAVRSLLFAYSSGWIVPKNMIKYGLLTTIIHHYCGAHRRRGDRQRVLSDYSIIL